MAFCLLKKCMLTLKFISVRVEGYKVTMTKFNGDQKKSKKHNDIRTHRSNDNTSAIVVIKT